MEPAGRRRWEGRAWIDRTRLLRGQAAAELLGIQVSTAPPARTFGKAPGPEADLLLEAYRHEDGDEFDLLVQALLDAGRIDVLDLAVRKIGQQGGDEAAASSTGCCWSRRRGRPSARPAGLNWLSSQWRCPPGRRSQQDCLHRARCPTPTRYASCQVGARPTRLPSFPSRLSGASWSTWSMEGHLATCHRAIPTSWLGMGSACCSGCVWTGPYQFGSKYWLLKVFRSPRMTPNDAGRGGPSRALRTVASQRVR